MKFRDLPLLLPLLTAGIFLFAQPALAAETERPAEQSVIKPVVHLTEFLMELWQTVEMEWTALRERASAVQSETKSSEGLWAEEEATSTSEEIGPEMEPIG